MPDRPALDPDRLERAVQHVRAQVDSGRVTYASLAVARSDGLATSVARRAHARVGEDADATRRSAIASISKPITATAVMQLVETGDLVLHEPLTAYLPDWRDPPPAPGEPVVPITTWHILTHTAGFRDADPEVYRTAPPTRAAVLERLAAAPLAFRPGSAYAYATDSFQLLAELVERIRGRPFADVLRTDLLDPLGMTATSFDPREPGTPGLAIEGLLGPPGVPPDVVLAYFVALAMPGGGLWSTAEDIARFGRAMLLGGALDGVRVLGRPFVAAMTRLQTQTVTEWGTGRPPEYALGWGLTGMGPGEIPGRSAFGHGGATGSTLIVDPEHDLVVVYLRNEWGASDGPADEAVALVYAALD